MSLEKYQPSNNEKQHNMNNKIEAFIVAAIAEHCGNQYERLRLSRSGLGCINETWKASGDGLEPLFVKVGGPEAKDMYEKEIAGLALLRQVTGLRIPDAFFVASGEDCACLVMEFIELGPVRAASEKPLGEGLAELHSLTRNQFGLEDDNYIGRSVQINGQADEWWTFFCEKRLGVQWEAAEDNGMRLALLDRIADLIARVPVDFASHQPRASLLHGDLWNGNVSADPEGKPCIYDPAVYFGDAETDIAMSKMFQPLGPRVYQAYHSHHPLQPGHESRRALYDLYHWLNHFNLFGVTYLGQVEHCVDVVLNELR